jgi:P-type Cu2+ transporter
MNAAKNRCMQCGQLNYQQGAFCSAGCAGSYALTKSLRHQSSSDSIAKNKSNASNLPVNTDAAKELAITVHGMHCASCARRIEQGIRTLPGIDIADVDLGLSRLRLVFDSQRSSLVQIVACVEELGFRCTLPTDPSAASAELIERRNLIKRIGIAGLATMQVMMLAEPSYLSKPGQLAPSTWLFFGISQFVVTTPVFFYCGWPYFRRAFRAVSAHYFGMDGLIALSLILAYFASIAALFSQARLNTYFEDVCMFLFFLSVSQWLQRRMQIVARANLDRLIDASPKRARKLDASGIAWPIDADKLNLGDRIQVLPGESLPADAILETTRANFDESLLSGESAAVTHRCGDRIFAGSVVLDQSITAMVAQVGAQMRLSAMMRLAQRARAKRVLVIEQAEKIASYFATTMVILVLCAGAYWWLVEPSRIAAVAVSMLMVACPCALALALPTALAAAQDVLLQQGILLMNTGAIRALAKADVLLSDKTGTLTTPGLQPIGAVDLTYAHIASALAASSNHAVARALQAQLPKSDLRSHDVRHVGGFGIEGEVNGQTYRLGRCDWIQPTCALEADEIGLGHTGNILLRWRQHEQLRIGAHDMAASLSGLGVSLHIVSGDVRGAVDRVATALHAAHARSRQSAADKLHYLHRLQTTTDSHGRPGKQHVVIGLGDGINDTALLAGADVGIAMGGADDLARVHADVVLLNNDLRLIPSMLVVARKTVRIARQNVLWALGYNALMLPLSASGLLPTWLAALGMSVSSLLVMGNALRLRSQTFNRQSLRADTT